jgi:hypothetical protein
MAQTICSETTPMVSEGQQDQIGINQSVAGILTAMALCLALACVIAIWTVIAMSAVPAKADRGPWKPWSSEGRVVHV